MIAFESSGPWLSTAQITVTVGVDSDTYTLVDTDAVTAMNSLVAWLNLAARPWADSAQWTWTWARQASTAGAVLTLLSTSGDAFSITLNANFTTVLGFMNAGAATSITAPNAAAGTWAPKGKVQLLANYRTLEGRGDAGGAGGCRSGVPGLALDRPTVQAVGTALDASRLSGMLANATHPRRGRVWQAMLTSWVTCAIGEVRRARADYLLWRFDFAVASPTN